MKLLNNDFPFHLGLIFRFQLVSIVFLWELELSDIEPTHHKTQRANRKKTHPPWDVFLQRTREGRQDFLCAGRPRYRMIWGGKHGHRRKNTTFFECDLGQFSGYKHPTIMNYLYIYIYIHLSVEKKQESPFLGRHSGTKKNHYPILKECQDWSVTLCQIVLAHDSPIQIFFDVEVSLETD